ncbi:hypothetical protein [Ferruginivarius sediminum]|uniref:Uncharacterized protein n=1 Tax=Ferruginivarius sediminum TaxID=2661937 RepID=A0A369T880_9PROT|nr:hypothetical protein [Ferruginivarius sediminum]RDD61102.1 hypothetical protein DRB17_14480 [Ferruginivarius sediminum]
MLPSLSEVAYAIYGAWRLLQFDRRGHDFFEISERAFWQSFFAGVIVLPGYAILVLLHLNRAEVGADALSVAIIHLLAYTMNWTAFPLAAYYLALGMDKESRWLGFVVALNWSKVIQLLIYLPLIGLAASGIAGPGASGLLSFGAMILVLVYQWYVTRTAFDITGMQAAGFTGLDVVLGIFITTLTDTALAA